MRHQEDTPMVSPDGLFIWNGEFWIDSPPGTVQNFILDEGFWREMDPEESGLILSANRKKIWTGKDWIPSPPIAGSLRFRINQNKSKDEYKSNFNFLGNRNIEFRKLSSSDSLKSIIIGLLVFFVTTTLLSSQIIQPLLYDASIVRMGRYSITFDAWDSIEIEEDTTIVGIGSSMLQYAMNGTCIEEEMGNEDLSVFNLAIPGSMPYMEMIQTEAAIRASPDMIMIEVGPNSLWDVDEYSSVALMNYFELRLSILSLDLNKEDEGDWLEILRDSELEMLDDSFNNRYRSESLFANDAVEEFLKRIVLDRSSAPREVSAAYVPHPSHDNWLNYLSTQNWLYSKLELMDAEKRSSWENITVVNAVKYGVNKPESNGTLNHQALEYMVSKFSDEGIEVVLVSPPLHHLLLDELAPDQYEGHNQTLIKLSEFPNVNVMNLVWEDYWVDDDFYDHNHLDRNGRETFCKQVSPILKEILSD